MEHYIEMKIPLECAYAIFDDLHFASRVGNLNPKASAFRDQLYIELCAYNFERRFCNEENDEEK